MTDAGRVESYFRAAFSKLTDDQGRPIDIGLALPTLVKIVSGAHNEFAEQKYDFLGDAACQFAINGIVARHYPLYDNRILSALVKKFRDLSRLHKILDQEIHLKDHVLAPYVSQTMDSILGVLNSFYGIKVVEKFVESAVIHIVGIELGLVQTKKTQLELQNQENENPIFAFNRLIYTNNGTIDTTSQDAPNRSWQIKITAKLNSTSLLFSHSRIGQSKQKAKTEAAKDILNFLAQRPDIYEQLQQPGDSMAEVHTLPISEEDYYHLTPVTAISTDNLFQQPRQQQQQQQQQQEQQQQLQNQQRTLNTTDWAGGDPSNIHISYTDDEDAIQLMSNLLLNGNSGSVDVEMSDESPTKKRQRQSIFSPFCDPVARDNNDDNSRTPFMPVPSSSAPPSDQHPVIKTEDSASAILAALHQPPPLPPTPRSPVTYIKNEEELNMFNQPFIAPVYNEKVVAFFKKIFIPHRHLLIQTLDMPGQSKSVFLSLAVQHQDIVHVDVKAQQGGPSHGPVFNALVTLRSKLKPQVFLKTEGMAKRKKDAEQMAFSKLIQLLK